MSELLLEVLARARTFKIKKWKYHEQAMLNPYMLASVGYECSDTDTITCSICHHSVYFDPEDILRSQEVLQHKQNCIYLDEKMRMISKEELYLHMDCLMEEIAKINKSYPNKMYPVVNGKHMLEFICEERFTLNQVCDTYKISLTNLRVQFFLQFFGWSIYANPECPCMSCYFCGRQVPFEQIDMLQEEIQPVERVYNETTAFDVINQHRYFCVWVNQTKGWTIYLQHLYDKGNEINGLKLKQAPIEIKKMRVQIDKFMETFLNKTTETFARMQILLKQCEALNTKIANDANVHSQEGVIECQTQNKRMRETSEEIRYFTIKLDSELRPTLKKIKLN